MVNAWIPRKDQNTRALLALKMINQFAAQTEKPIKTLAKSNAKTVLKFCIMENVNPFSPNTADAPEPTSRSAVWTKGPTKILALQNA